jgi:hypothetical protein
MFADGSRIPVHEYERAIRLVVNSWISSFVQVGGRRIYVEYTTRQLPSSTQSQETYPVPVPAADKTLDEMSKWGPNWNGRNFDAPHAGAITNARMQVDVFRRVSKITGLRWCEPHVTASPDGEPVFEWWYGARKLTIYFQERSADYVKVWGPNVHSDMEDGKLGDFEPLLKWLTAV